MAYYCSLIKDYLFQQAALHQLDPWLFLVLYLMSKLLFLIFIGRAVKNIRQKRPYLLPSLFAALGYSLPYLYMIIAGKNIPLWIFGVITVIYLCSGWSIYTKLREARLSAAKERTI
jgi:FtsH-binding integral membrane protein